MGTGAGAISELDVGRQVLRDEARALESAAARLGEEFRRAVDLVVACADSGGTLLVTGLGKSGLIGGKISATFASLGIPSHSVHPSEAAHGDLGRFRSTDTVLALSHSGETDEVVNLCAILRQDGLPIVSITRGSEGGRSSLERLSTVCLSTGVREEADGGEAPTSSTSATLGLGDALAVAAARRRRFSAQDFARHHPGGSLGGLLRPVVELLRFRAGENLPLVHDGCSVAEALRRAAAGGRRPGAMVLVEPKTGRLSGIFTDGDLRRLVLQDVGLLDRPVAEVMTRSPRTLVDTALVRDAIALFREFRQDEIPVVDGEGRPVGVLDVQDLMAMRLVRDEG